MTDRYTCPNCGQSIETNERLCNNCGATLAIAAAMAEDVLAETITPIKEISLAPEILAPRLGGYLVEKGFVNQKQLNQALDFQNSQAAQGTYLLLGHILVSQGTIDQAQLDLAITEQIVLLQNALQETNQQLEQRVKQRTVELQNALERLTELNQLKTNFISSISHELRTPLAHMSGYIDLLITKELGPLNEEQSKAVGVLQNSYSNLHQLIDDLLEFSMASEGQMSLEPAPISAASLIELAVHHVQNQAASSQVEVIANQPAEEIGVLADGKKITWVLEELLENSIKFNHPGGTVQLDTKLNEKLILFSISDTGIGIEESRLEEIFEPFHQLDGSSTRNYGGTGIGLALVKKIVEAHGTTLKIHSKHGQGTRFEFSLPTT